MASSLLLSLHHAKIQVNKKMLLPLKGGDPAPGSPRATLLRLHPSYQSYLGSLPLEKLAQLLLVQPTPVV